VKNYPRLDSIPSVVCYAKELARESAEFCRSCRAVSHPLAWYDPMIGGPIESSELFHLADRLTEAAQRAGYPQLLRPGDGTRIADFELSVALFKGLEISPVMAAEPGLWNFLAIALVPDLVRWRFPTHEGGSDDGTIDRWLVGSRSNRQAFERLWWRAFFLRDPDATDPWQVFRRLKEDDFIAIVERTNLVGYQKAVLSLARAVIARVDAGSCSNQGELTRSAAKLLRRKAAFIELHSLDSDALDKLTSSICEEAEMDIKSPATSPDDRLVPTQISGAGSSIEPLGISSKKVISRTIIGERLKIASRTIEAKLMRIRAGGTPRFVDLFCGCGGISLGMAKAGMDAVAGFDADAPSMRTWWSNFHPESGLHRRADPSIDITAHSASSALAWCGYPDGVDGVDVLVGGPPCQAYSRAGRSKINNLRGEAAHLDDERGGLYEHFLRYVAEISPLAVVVENVPDALNYGGDVIPIIICQRLNEMGYHAHFTILNSANYGVPQFRDRVFILGVHKAASTTAIPFPKPSHKIHRLPDSRLNQSRMVKVCQEHPQWASMPPEELPNLPNAFTVHQALDDLPRIFSRNRNSGNLGCVDMQGLLPYSRPPNNCYQELMRNWKGFSTDGLVSANLLREVKRDFEIFARMNHGDEYPEARKIHESVFSEEITRRRSFGQAIKEGDTLWTNIYREMVPPYDTTKFSSKWWKMVPEQPSRTIVAHLQMDTYSHIHYDSDQARAITVREAARLQSFPDGFRFLGAMKEGYRQIGNAVPPLTSAHLSKEIILALTQGCNIYSNSAIPSENPLIHDHNMVTHSGSFPDRITSKISSTGI
jgi:DNA (cytosine-5)-methyltransferase 1